MGETNRFHQVGVDMEVFAQLITALVQVTANGASDLSHFDGVGEPRTVKIIFAGLEHLGFGLQPAESRSVNDPIAVDLKTIPVVVGMALGNAGLVEVRVEAVLHVRLNKEVHPSGFNRENGT